MYRFMYRLSEQEHEIKMFSQPTLAPDHRAHQFEIYHSRSCRATQERQQTEAQGWWRGKAKPLNHKDVRPRHWPRLMG